jgi:hypothetical protein
MRDCDTGREPCPLSTGLRRLFERDFFRDLVVIANVHSGRLFFLPSTSSLFISAHRNAFVP